MSYLLDTDVVIYHLNDLTAASELVDALFDGGVAISIITSFMVVEDLAEIIAFLSLVTGVLFIPFVVTFFATAKPHRELV